MLSRITLTLYFSIFLFIGLQVLSNLSNKIGNATLDKQYQIVLSMNVTKKQRLGGQRGEGGVTLTHLMYYGATLLQRFVLDLASSENS